MNDGAAYPSLPDHLVALLAIACAVAVGVVALVDVILIALLARDVDRERPLFAPRWSVAHIVLGIQAWLLGTLAISFPIVLFILQWPRTQQAWGMLPILILQNVVMVVVVVACVRLIYREPLAVAGMHSGSLMTNLLLGLAVGAVAIPASDLVQHLSTRAVDSFLPSAVREALDALSRMVDIQEFLLKPLHSPAGLAALILVVGIIGPLGEEIFFRGFAHTALRRRFGPVLGLLASAGLFAVIHLNPAALIPIFVMGLLLGALYDRTGSLAAPFALHAVNNTFAVIVAYFAPDFSLWSSVLNRG